MGVCCCISFKHVDNGVRTWAKFDGHIYHWYPLICKSTYLPFIIYYKSAFVVVYKHLNTKLHIAPSKPRFSYTYLLGGWRYGEKHAKYTLAVDMCCCLQICNSIVNVVVMRLILGQGLMVICTTGVLLYAKVSPLYNVLEECFIVVYS